MLIMFYKETEETRNKMTDVVIEFSVLPKCSRFLLPQHLGIGKKMETSSSANKPPSITRSMSTLQSVLRTFTVRRYNGRSKQP